MERLLATSNQNTWASGKLQFFPTSRFIMFSMLLVGKQIIFVTSDTEVPHCTIHGSPGDNVQRGSCPERQVCSTDGSCYTSGMFNNSTGFIS